MFYPWPFYSYCQLLQIAIKFIEMGEYERTLIRLIGNQYDELSNNYGTVIILEVSIYLLEINMAKTHDLFF